MALITKGALTATVELGYNTGTVEYGLNKDNREPTWVGTGVVAVDIAENRTSFESFVFTVRHVVERILENSDSVAMRFSKNSAGSTILRQPLSKSDGPTYCFHPNIESDVAVIPLFHVMELLTTQHNFKGIAFADLLQIKDLKALDCFEGDQILVVGYPYSLPQIAPRSRAYPVVRGGVISRIQDLYAGESEVFLIDATVFPGNSGAPVFITPELSHLKETKPANRSACIGLVSEYLDYRETASSDASRRARVYFIENSGLAKVEPIDKFVTTARLWQKDRDERKALESVH